MSKTLWTFGDSFTQGFSCIPIIEYPTIPKYYEYKTIGDDIWPNLLSKYLGIKLINKGLGGISNDSIIDIIIDNWDSIKPGDIVIIGMTFNVRIDVPIKENKKLKINKPRLYSMSNLLNSELINDMTENQKETIINFQYYFANSELFKERNIKRFNHIKKLLEANEIFVFVWELENEANKYETITTATNNIIEDNHWSFKGNYDFSKFLMKKLKFDYNNKLI